MTNSQYLIFNIDSHYFAASLSNMQDVIKLSKKTPVPLSQKNISGLLNLRGHIVTEINVSQTLGLKEKVKSGFAVVINRDDELYSLAFEGIGDVIEISFSEIEPLPETVQKNWHQLAKGVYRMGDKLIVILDLELFVDLLIDKEVKEAGDLEQQYA